MDKAALAMLVAGLLLVTLAFVTPQPKSGAPSVAVETRAAQPEVEGRLLIYVNGELKYSGKVHSFLKPAPTFLAVGFFPTSSFRSASVTLYSETPSTWSPDYPGETTTISITAGDGVWGICDSIAPLLLVYDTKGNKWTEITLSTTPSIYRNETGVLLSVSGSVTPSLSAPTNVSMLRLVRPTGVDSWGSTLYAVRLAEDSLPPVTVNPGDSLTVVYQFYFKADQIFTANWASAFFAWLYNVQSAKINVTVTDGSTDYIDPYRRYVAGILFPTNNVIANCYIVVGNGQATFSRTAYRVVSEVARAEPSVQVYGGGVSLSYAFTFSQDTAITELAVYVKLTNGKEVMLLYYVLPQPTVAKAGVPFTVTFRINLPWMDRV